MDTLDHRLLARKFKESGYTYNRLQDEIQVSRSTLYNIMRGIHKPSYTVAYLINEALFLTQEDILAIYFPNAKSEKELTL